MISNIDLMYTIIEKTTPGILKARLRGEKMPQTMTVNSDRAKKSVGLLWGTITGCKILNSIINIIVKSIRIKINSVLSDYC